MSPVSRTGVAALGAAAWNRCRVTPTTKGDFCPTLPLAAAHSAQRLAERHAVRGMLLRGKVFADTTPAVQDIGGASICIQLEEHGGDGGRLVELLDGGYLMAVRPEGRGTGFLPAVAGVPGRQGLDRAGRSRIGLAECLVMARPVRLAEDAEGHVTFLHDAALRGWLSDEKIVDVVLLARVTDFFLGLNAGTWLRIRISDIASASARWLVGAGCLGESGTFDELLNAAGLDLANEVEPPPEDASQLWHFWGGGGNTGMSGQMTNNPELVPSETEESRAFHFSHKGVAVSVSERRRQPKDPLATDYTGDLVWPTAVAFSRYICEKHGLEGTRALDVGAGTGLVGLVVHRMGAKSVTFTDVPRVIPLLSRNVALHCLADATRKADPAETQAGEAIVRPLLWGEAEAEALVQERGHFDLVLCCEVVYQQPQQVWQSLQAVLKRVLARPGGRVVFAYQHRDGAEVTDAQFFETLEEACGVHLESEESLSAWDDAWDDIDFRWVRTYVATAAAQL